MKLCLPIQESSQAQVLQLFETYKEQYDIFEVWLDSIENPDIPAIIQASPLPLLFVCKAKEEKGKFQGTEEERIELLIQAAQAGADYIDIGIHTNPALIQKFQENKGKSQLILSFHNWDTTPKMTTMLTRIHEMQALRPDIMKYVATARSEKDNIQIFRLAENLKEKGQKFVVMCMGKHGAISRVFSPMLGGEWMYAPADASKASAPGQILAEELKNMWKVLS